VTAAAVDEVLPHVTEPEARYRESVSPDGRAVPAGLLLAALRPLIQQLAPVAQPAVRMPGAFELQHLAGPVRADVDHRVQVRVLTVAQDPQAERLWWQAELTEAAAGRPVARVVNLERFLPRPHGEPARAPRRGQ
jgi:hypothetical protein